MENQDNNPQKAHPKPSEDAQNQVETIVPSTETEESKTTEIKPLEKPDTEKSAEEKTETEQDASTKVNTESTNTDEKPENAKDTVETDDSTDKQIDEPNTEEKPDKPDEGDKIETVAP
ncbi:hypothetical protein [Pedobacter jamesrossensis]|uniref:Uncharacterized protein n=1 Tax=Pedobacter jamesrossensis TaxID=1908238 RepID=A0ABV8NMX5_9SPHI